MNELLQTKRLRIRRFMEADAQDLFAIKQDPTVSYYDSWSPYASITETIEYIHSQLSLPADAEGQWYAWAVVAKKLNKLIGYIEWKITNKHFAQAEIGWALHSDYRGKGYAFEAAHACIDHSFNTVHLHRITATCDPQNIRSIHLAEKLGMTREGCMREVIRKDGIWRDLLLYAILSHEWPPPNNVKEHHDVT